MASYLRSPVISGLGAYQSPSGYSQPNIQTGPRWNSFNYNTPQTASIIPSSYDYTAERVRNNPDGPSSVDLPEAKYLYNQVFRQGGLDLSPWELGHAAAYQAYRILRDDPPIESDTPFERETLIGLAVAEASKLIRQNGRGQAPGATIAASETAARTASRIFDQTQSVNTDERYSRERPSQPIYRGTRDYSDPDYYAEDDEDVGISRSLASGMRGRRSPSRARHPSFAETPTVVPNAFPGYYASTHSSQADTSYGGVTRFTAGRRYPPTPHPAASFNNTLPQVYPQPQTILPYQNTQVPITQGNFAQPRSASLMRYSNQTSYPSTYAHPQTANSNMQYTYQSPAEQTIIIQRPRKHRHKHHRRHRSR